jgi:DNA-binding response OmpR family regulator
MILLVEDDANLRQSIVLILQRSGFFVSATENTTTALDLLKSGGYNLVITDLNIPGINDMFLTQVLDIYPYVSIVILTDQSALEAEGDDRLLSAHYLIKPIAPELLLDQIIKIIGKPMNNIQHTGHCQQTNLNESNRY